MIISASRRTDIPAFYNEWFYNRIREGFVYVKNPMNPRQISMVSLKPEAVDCIVFWTKNPEKMIPDLKIIDNLGIAYYFQFTITSYDQEIETRVPLKKDIIDTFINLSEKIGKERVIWRYDPVLLTRKITVAYHIKNFENLVSELHKYTDKCVISFIDFYKKSQRNMKPVNPLVLDEQKKMELAVCFKTIGDEYDLDMETCAEDIHLFPAGFSPGKCIDDKLAGLLSRRKIDARKDKNQRRSCGCVKSIDIGAYNTCRHGCLYCYANYSDKMVNEKFHGHNPVSPLLSGEIGYNDTTEVKQ